MVQELERVCDGVFLQHVSDIDGAVAVVAQTSHLASASCFDKRPLKSF